LLHVNKKNWKAIALCILAATIFWFLDSLNDNYTANVNFPLEFEYNEEAYIPVEPLPDHLTINVSGMGWDLFRRSAGLRVTPLVIPLDRPATVHKIVGSTLPALFSDQLEGLEINFVVNDTIYLNIEPRDRKWLTLRIDSIERFLRPGYGIVSPIRIRPDSVMADGPLSHISELRRSVSLVLEHRNIDEDYDEEVEVYVPGRPLITFSPPSVNVTFQVEEYVEVTDSVRLVLVNLPESAKPDLQIEKLPVTVRVRRSLADHLAWDSMRAVVNLKGFEGGKISAEPQVDGLPGGAKVVDIDSVHITY
jgi:YbbR domain-containing protein